VTERSRLAVEGIALDVEHRCGILSGLKIQYGGKTITPLHRAPWVDADDETPPDAPLHLRRLAGDFFCAPFGGSDPAVPPHGWAANGLWTERERQTPKGGGLSVTFELDETISGARLEKTIALLPGHPVVYQTHVFRGGSGQVSVSHHAMIHVPGGARLSFSRKAMGATPPEPLDDGEGVARSLLAYPQRFESLASVGLSNGGSADIHTYPFAEGHEDFLTLYEEAGEGPGWSAAVAAADGFIFFALKDRAALPQTALWMSNGGRQSAPWNGRHRHVLGIEEGCSDFALDAEALGKAGQRAALALDPARPTVVRYALGAIPIVEGFREVAAVEMADDRLELVDVGGRREAVPFDGRFFFREM
jgi:hypothetical protein